MLYLYKLPVDQKSSPLLDPQIYGDTIKKTSLNYPKATISLSYMMSHTLHLTIRTHHYSIQNHFQLQSNLEAHFPS